MTRHASEHGDRARTRAWGSAMTVLAVLALLTGSVPAAGASSALWPPQVVDDNVDRAQKVAAGDLDGDDDVDLVSSSPSDDTLAWHEQRGEDDYRRHNITQAYDDPLGVDVGDMDGDGDLDVIVGARLAHTLAWFENDGTGQFTEHVVADYVDFVFAVHAADVDRDGDTDVVTPEPGDEIVSWWENDGSGNLDLEFVHTDGDEDILYVSTGDVNGDGETDVLTAAPDVDRVSWHENDGSESFTQHVVTKDALEVRSVAAADVDQDGRTDVVSADPTGAVTWYENEPSGPEAFTPHTVTEDAEQAMDVIAEDVDRDDDPDLLYASLKEGSSVAWLENDGTGSFTQHVLSDRVGGASVTTADVDGDGDTDAAVAFRDDTVAWFEHPESFSSGAYEGIGSAGVFCGLVEAIRGACLGGHIFEIPQASGTALDVAIELRDDRIDPTGAYYEIRNAQGDVVAAGGFCDLTALPVPQEGVRLTVYADGPAFGFLDCGFITTVTTGEIALGWA